MNSAQEILRQHGVEIDLGDHRPPEEIVVALGLTAAVAVTMTSQASLDNSTESMKRNRPFFVK